MMWPLLATSLVALTTVLERIVFSIREAARRDPKAVTEMLRQTEMGNVPSAIATGRSSRDFVARVFLFGLEHRDVSYSGAVLQAANRELRRFNRGITILDTIVTLAPLEGLFGTVTGMIHAFGLLGASELGAPAAITGGIAEALIATAFGLVIAMTALIPFNYVTAKLEEARLDIETATAQGELALLRRAQDVPETVLS